MKYRIENIIRKLRDESLKHAQDSHTYKNRVWHEASLECQIKSVIKLCIADVLKEIIEEKQPNENQTNTDGREA